MKQEPTRITAGNSYSWTKSLNYLASDGWVIRYSIVNISSATSISGSEESPGEYSFSLPASVSVQLDVGEYRLVGYAANTGQDERVTFYSSSLTVSPDPTSAGDFRTYAAKTLDAIESMIAKTATKDQQSVTVDGQTLSRRSIPDLIILRDRFKREVAREKHILKAKKAGRNPGKIGIRLK